MNMLDRYESKIDYIIDNYALTFLKSNNVTGIGRGKKIINNQWSSTPSLSFLVKKKMSIGELSLKDRIPKRIAEIYTDIVEYGEAEDFAINYPKYPAVSGGELIDENGKVATLTYAVTERKDEKSIFFLANRHFLDDEKNNVLGKKIYYQRGEDESAKFLLGLGVKVVPLAKKGKVNEVDAGIGFAGLNNAETRKFLKSGLIDNTVIKGVINDIEVKENVYKIGRSSGRTGGEVVMVNCTQTIRDNLYKKQIIVEMLSYPGDSGALGVRKSDDSAFGMLMSRGKGKVTFNYLYRVLEILDVKLLGQ